MFLTTAAEPTRRCIMLGKTILHGVLNMPDHAKNPYLIETNDVVKYYPIMGGVFLKQVASVKAVDGTGNGAEFSI